MESKYEKVAYNNQYNAEKYDRYSLMLPKGKKEIIQEYAKQNGLELGKITDKILLGLERCDGHCPCKYAMWQKTKPEQLDDIILAANKVLEKDAKIKEQL